jgi:hypothetical protein
MFNNKRLTSRMGMATALAIGSVVGALVGILIFSAFVYFVFTFGSNAESEGLYGLALFLMPFQSLNSPMVMFSLSCGAIIAQMKVFENEDCSIDGFQGWKTDSDIANAILYGVLTSIVKAMQAFFMVVLAEGFLDFVESRHIPVVVVVVALISFVVGATKALMNPGHIDEVLWY